MTHDGAKTMQVRSKAFRPWLLLVLLAIAAALRFGTFGDPNLHVDEAFYQTVGVAMHHGALPYVDIWDRKPWGLFFVYYLIAFFSSGPLAYQLVAALFAAATAWVIGRFASRWAGLRGGLLAGIVYLLWLDPLQGFGGQSPVFYNLFMATAALLVFRSGAELRAGRAPGAVPVAMLLAGLAITVKPTALFEAAFLGLYAAILLLRSPAPRPRAGRAVLGWVLIGAAPMLAISAWYALHGYWAIYWQAMVLASLDRPQFAYAATMRFLVSFILLAPVLVVATLSLATWQGEARRFVGWWLLAALLGLVSVPNFYMHYSLPLLVPLSIVTASFLSRPIGGPVALACLAAWSWYNANTLDYHHTRRSQAAMAALVQAIRSHDDGAPLFVVDGPPQLYILTGHAFPTPLVFPHHLGDASERDLSHLSTIGETLRVLGLRPGTIVMPDTPRQDPANLEVIGAVTAYVTQHCRKVATIDTPDVLTSSRMNVWAGCRAAHRHRS
jgi:MFS family permease